MRIGVDVGGTHTDAVLMDGDRVINSVKSLTTADVSSGIFNALQHILSGVDTTTVEAVMLGTTQFTNAVIERKHLSEVAAVRIGLPSGDGLPPKTGWPEDIAKALGDHVYMLHGGTLFDGSPLDDLRQDEIDSLIADIKQKQLSAVTISAAFSPMNPEPELEVARQIKAAIPDMEITCSHEIGRLGLLERENAALLNASLLRLSQQVVRSFGTALKDLQLSCPFFISQNDGTLMDSEFVQKYPALTFSSGPTNSLRGACKLTGLDDAIVIDIGGTTSDIGILQGGFPRESNIVIEVGGVRTNFRMPDILALGLGGGSRVNEDGTTIGPDSVGHDLVTMGLSFGGDVMTTTDIQVAAGNLDVKTGIDVSIDEGIVENALGTIHRMLNEGVEKMMPTSEQFPVIMVGGGAVLATEKLDAAAKMLTPENSGVANAIGAAIAQIGGEVERLVNYRETPRDEVLEEVSAEATEQAIKAGADPDTIRIADIEEITISYMAEGSTKLRVKAIGDILLSGRGD